VRGGHFEYHDLRPFLRTNLKNNIIIRANTLSDQENKVLHKVMNLLAPETILLVRARGHFEYRDLRASGGRTSWRPREFEKV
jgi:hypothetical protein